jgi:uracil-DNA glycosylase family 4
MLCDGVRDCVSCPNMHHAHVLSSTNGALHARVLFIAEAPGRRGAAITGVPLFGDEAGRRFEAFLSLAGLSRGDVFVTNAVLCNPLDKGGHNRTPSVTEVARCRPFLERTLDFVPAPVIVALGRVALAALHAIAPHRLTLLEAGNPIAWRDRTLVALYHPGRQSTLHRSQQRQDADWRQLGNFLRPPTTRADCHP